MSEPERWLKRWGVRCWGDDSATVETTTVVTFSTTTRSRWDATREAARHADPMFYQKLADAKNHIPLAR
jgi:hypothetical protein